MRSLFVALAALCLTALPARAETWLVVSDIHLDPANSASTPSGYGSDTNWTLWTSTLAEMKVAVPHPAVVVVAGDALAHHFPNDPSLAESTMRRIAQSIAAAYPRVPVVFALGNNDDPCGDYRPSSSGAYLNALSGIWQRPLGNGGYYTAELSRATRAVVLDDVYWSWRARACPGSAGDPAQAELAWLPGALAQAPASAKDVLVAHVPPGVDVESTLVAHRLFVVGYLRADDERAFVGDLRASASRITFAIAGHAHRADFRALGGVPMIVAPSVSPIFDNNPAFMRLEVGAGDALVDYALYAYDPKRASWAQIFDFDRLYGATRVDLASMLVAHARIARDASVRAAWERTFVAGSPSGELNESNWRTAWCAQTTAGQAFEDCAGLRRRLLVIPVVATLFGIIIVASVLYIALWYARK